MHEISALAPLPRDETACLVQPLGGWRVQIERDVLLRREGCEAGPDQSEV